MAILPVTGRRSPWIRFVVLCVYALLIAGGVTIIYPFLIMVSGSVKGQADVGRMDPVPQVAYLESAQFSRFQEERYGSLAMLSAAYSRELLSMGDAKVPRVDTGELTRFRRFLKEKMAGFPDHFYGLQEISMGQRVLPRNFRKFRDEVRVECGSVESFNGKYRSALANWNDFPYVLDSPLTKEFCYEAEPMIDRYLKFKRAAAIEDKVILNLDGYYHNTQQSLPQVQGGEVKPAEILVSTRPSGDQAPLWDEFVKHRLNCLFVRLDDEGLRQFRRYLSNRFPRGIEDMNRTSGSSYGSFDAVNATFAELRNSAVFTLYTDFVTNVCSAKHLHVDTPSTRYRDYVKSAAAAPIVANDYDVFRRTRSSFLVEIFTRNYRNVVQFVAVYGRSVFNTVIFIGLSIIVALIVNPLAAYALSRFRLKLTYPLLMFFLATMAFPSAITMIPNFLLLKHLHLLNSFWALILPGAANGYSIFILKGFFDSIPREMYESAMIDGASESTMFWKFTMALSTPILALITLGAFTAAYTAFMFALIICPDDRMWTLMVWLYQLQQGAHQSVIYAALVIAAVPTLLVFALAQNVIMKGIVVPVEK